jgi:hypothetical protein
MNDGTRFAGWNSLPKLECEKRQWQRKITRRKRTQGGHGKVRKGQAEGEPREIKWRKYESVTGSTLCDESTCPRTMPFILRSGIFLRWSNIFYESAATITIAPAKAIPWKWEHEGLSF